MFLSIYTYKFETDLLFVFIFKSINLIVAG